ncbi:dihydroxyacetone kinase [Tetragenococcus halophilus subsp. flandriensis]|uniref:dihydroxyacetone kinase phosphoryl donor subunit DhaM n=1 Tax=Tetragenococcus halophilus TaxID=51669 RepID=UPI0023E8FEDA|nr:dihydroxyacetone kinase phosphoryl donor subunit DhaM [Tetragenococcus halophilus]GMA09369.1 dihydroxyacetone kinase [Tetragenococcus halophilus subsp. flandriensis]
MYSIILVSHSKKITDGIKEMIEEMVGESDNVKISSCGGADDGRLGTNSVAILDCIEASASSDKIYIFADIGSAILSAETAIDLIDDIVIQKKVQLIDSPLVEGAFAAAIQASVGSTEEEILKEIESV